MHVRGQFHRRLTYLVTGVVAIATMTLGVAGIASAALTSAAIAGVPGVGQQLTASSGGGTSPSYAWYDCTTATASESLTNGTPVPSSTGTCSTTAVATSATYTVQSSDVTSGPYLTVVATDTSTSSYWQAASVVATSETVSITGVNSAGETLTASPGAAGTLSYQWYDCGGTVAAGYAAAGGVSGCNAISGATNPTYALTGSDYGYYVTVTATLSPATTAAVAAASATVTEPAPAVASSPSLAVTASNDNAGTTTSALILSDGFTNLYNYTATYQWYDCGSTAVTTDVTSVPSACTPITTNGTGAQYTFTASDNAQNVSVLVTVSNTQGSAQLFAESVGPVVATAASATVFPALGTASATQVSASSLGTWTGAPAPTSWTVTWYRCAGTGPSAASSSQSSACTTVISGPTTYTSLTPSPMPSYTFTAADQGDSVLIGVVANNGVTSTYVAYSAASSVFTGSAPSVAVVPTITGTAAVGSVLTANHGTWSGAPQPTSYQYAWYYCNAAQAGSVTLPSGCTSLQASGSTYTVPVTAPNGTDLANTYILVVVTANNGIGSASYASASTTALTGPTPSTTGTLSVSVGVNAVATATPASFNGTPAPTSSSYAYTWYDCSATQGASSAPVSTLAALALSSGCHLSVTSTNSDTHTITASDVANSSGGGLVAVAEVTTLAGSVWVNSATSTAVLAYSAPTNGNLSVTGSGSLASPFTATATWTAEPAPTISYQWYMCSSTISSRSSTTGCLTTTATGTTFSPSTYNASYPYAVVAATAITYTATGAQYGLASTLYSNGTLLSPQSLSVTTYPSISVAPSSASVTTASTLSASTGVWQGVPAPTFTYQWYVCPSVTSSPGTIGTLPSTCTAIPGATASSYVPNGGYASKYFVAVVTGSNGTANGSLSVYTASTTSALVVTLSVTSITVVGTATAGSTLTAVSTIYSPNAYSAAYQWYACTAAITATVATPPSTCTAISGATAATFVATTTQTGFFLTVKETVTSGTSSATGTAVTTAKVTSNIPGAPASVTAYAGIGKATVTWTTPTTGLAATSYTVTATPGGATCTSTTLSCVVSGLLYGTSYTFTVKSTNSYGTSAPSVASNAVTPSESYPAAPTTVKAVAGNQTARISWKAAVNNGAVVTAYVVTAFPGGMTCTTSLTTCVVSGLTNGTPYTFTVTARNAVGVGPASLASATVIPRVSAAPAPINVVVRRGNGFLVVHWSAGIANGAVVSDYIVSATGGGVTRTCTTTGTSCVVRGLTNGVAYHVSVVARSASGSAVTNVPVAIAPAGRPSPPVIFHTFGGAGVIIVHFRAPAKLYGAPVAYYQYFINGRWTVQTLKGKLFAVVRGLLRHHAYIVRVRAVTFAGPSPASMWVRVITR